jgi:hypothetical protein
VESCGLPDRINKLFGTKNYGICKARKINISTFFPAVFGQIGPKTFPNNLPKLETFAE